jgi:hypothetical protein
MGGDHDHHAPKPPYPRRVWTPYGGWWPEPKNWKRNTALGLLGLLLSGAGLFYLSTRLERRPRPSPYPVWSQRWAKHTLEDDPDYPRKLEEWRRNRKPLWKRILPTEEDHEE